MKVLRVTHSLEGETKKQDQRMDGEGRRDSGSTQNTQNQREIPRGSIRKRDERKERREEREKKEEETETMKFLIRVKEGRDKDTHLESQHTLR